MSSPQASSTQSSDPSPTETSTMSMSPLYEQGQKILSEILELRDQEIYYAAMDDICSLCEFVYNKDIKGDMLVPKDDNMKAKTSEFILSGIFTIDARNFFMTLDGKWNANNTLCMRFEQVKLSCRLLPVEKKEEFAFSSDDFPKIVSNIHAIESLANPHKSRDAFSIIIGETGQPSGIKLSHQLFVVSHLHLSPSPNFWTLTLNFKRKKER